METTTYQLKSPSKKGISVEVQREYADKAKSLVDMATQDLAKLRQEIPNLPYLGNPGILARTGSLIQNPTSEKLQDEVFLRVCIYGTERIRGPDAEEAFQMSRNLIGIVDDLEHQD